MTALQHPVLDLFEKISKIPRQSKHEEKISAWLVQWAQSHGLKAVQDSALNVVIYVPATSGREDDPTVIVQSHMDMVCEKVPTSSHTFATDPIRFVQNGDWLHADQTSLGADNGIGMALALSLAVAPDISRPPLELLITSDEETGLNGAKSITPNHIAGSLLINLDSEDEGVFTIGCAGGRDATVTLSVTAEKPLPDMQTFRIAIDGLRGGHSGVDIREQRENANVLLGRILYAVQENCSELRLAAMSGGSAHNAIPRNAQAVLSIPSSDIPAFKAAFDQSASQLKTMVMAAEPAASIILTDTTPSATVSSIEDTRTIINLLNALPHGVAKMSTEMQGLVETSNNLATMSLENNMFTILTSQRSSVSLQLDWICSKIEAIAHLCGATVKVEEGYPGWEPNMHSPLLALCRKTYTQLFGKEPRVEAIHAGLECGIIGAKFEHLDMISLGPTVKNPHSPDEKLYMPSVPEVWDLLVGILKEIKR